MSTLDAWHFLPADGALRHNDGRTPKNGETITVEGPLELCKRGLHASVDPLHALTYAPGLLLCRVRLSGVILTGDDKVCATERTILWRADATETVVAFARWCAERAKGYAAADAAADAAAGSARHAADAAVDSVQAADAAAYAAYATAAYAARAGLAAAVAAYAAADAAAADADAAAQSAWLTEHFNALHKET